MPPSKGRFNRKGAKGDEAEPRRGRKSADSAESGLLDEVAAGYYGGDPTGPELGAGMSALLESADVYEADRDDAADQVAGYDEIDSIPTYSEDPTYSADPLPANSRFERPWGEPEPLAPPPPDGGYRPPIDELLPPYAAGTYTELTDEGFDRVEPAVRPGAFDVPDGVAPGEPDQHRADWAQPERSPAEHESDQDVTGSAGWQDFEAIDEEYFAPVLESLAQPWSTPAISIIDDTYEAPASEHEVVDDEFSHFQAINPFGLGNHALEADAHASDAVPPVEVDPHGEAGPLGVQIAGAIEGEVDGGFAAEDEDSDFEQVELEAVSVSVALSALIVADSDPVHSVPTQSFSDDKSDPKPQGPQSMTDGTAKPTDHIERLRRGLELVITEDQVMSLAGRAISQQVPTIDTELLLSANSESLNRVMATGPKNEGAGCSVSDTRACPAIRLQRMLVFENSEFLDACPYLAVRSGDPVGAVCIPFSMPDDVGGVLHATSPVDDPISESTIDDLALTMTLVSRRSYEIRSGESLGTEGVAAAVAQLLQDRLEQESLSDAPPAAPEPAPAPAPRPASKARPAEPARSAPRPATAKPLPQGGARSAAIADVSNLYTADDQASSPEIEGHDVVESIVESLVAAHTPLALGLVHLDKFRLYNRTHGADVADAAVRRFREIATSIIRPNDTLASDGGDEFFLVFLETSAVDAAIICERIRTELAASFVDESLPRFTVSIGIADTEDGATFDDLIELVERSVVQAEAAGRDIVVTAGTLAAKHEGDTRPSTVRQ